MPDKPEKKLFLIDGHSYSYQAYYGIKELSTPDGRPINAVYGFVNMINKILKEEQPSHIAVIFDFKGPSFRQLEFEEYKAHRKPMPDELREQIPIIKEVLEAYGIPIFEVEGVEADDVIGSLSKDAAQNGLPTFIVSRDKDVKQLLGPQTFIYNTRDGGVYCEADLCKETSLSPCQIPDLLGLMGDTSDNVPGVPGIGEKTALKLLSQWGTLENILDHAGEVKSQKVQNLLQLHAGQALQCKKLATIKTDLSSGPKVRDCIKEPPSQAKLQSIFQHLGFKKFLSGILAQEEKVEYRAVRNEKEFEEFLRSLKKEEEFSLDLESTGINPLLADIVGLSFSWKEKEAFYLPVRVPPGEVHLDWERIKEPLREILEDPRIGKVGQNIKYDLLLLRRAGIRLQGIRFDSMLGAYLLSPGRKGLGLDDLAMEFLGRKNIPITDLIGNGKEQKRMDEVPLPLITVYACEDADVALRLTKVFREKIQEKNLKSLMEEIELPLIQVLGEMEWNGIAVDLPVLEQMSRELEDRLKKLEKEVFSLAGKEFNIASPKQLREILFETLNLPQVKRIKTGYSTDAEVLEELSYLHPLPKKLLEHRQVSKLKSTYVDALPKLVSPETGRIHTSFNQTITATGRLSSSNPNLQNIPVRNPDGKRIREAFVARDQDHVFLSADYSQIELRVMAHLSGDAALSEAFRNDEDIHTFVASEIQGIPKKEVTKEMRRGAKAINFGIIYGLTPYGLSKDLNVSQGDAKRFIDAYFRKYEGVKAYIDRVIEEAQEKGYVTTLFNRLRYIPGINSSDKARKSLSERFAVNTVIQGSAADLMKIAMNRIYQRIEKEGLPCLLLVQLHDELLLEVPLSALEDAKAMVREEMAGAIRFSVPLKVNCSTGKNWGEVD